MAKYPFHGEGIEIRRNFEDGKIKYNIFVDPQLKSELLSGTWTAGEQGREVIGYEVSDENYSAVAGDEDCRDKPGNPGG